MKFLKNCFFVIALLMVLVGIGKLHALEDHSDVYEMFLANANLHDAYLAYVFYDELTYNYGGDEVEGIALLVIPNFRYDDIGEKLSIWLGIRMGSQEDSIGKVIIKGLGQGLALSLDEGKTSLTLEMILLKSQKWHIYRAYDNLGDSYKFAEILSNVQKESHYDAAFNLGKTSINIHRNQKFQYVDQLVMVYSKGYLENEDANLKYYVGSYDNIAGVTSVKAQILR